jgi:hypothetical protein
MRNLIISSAMPLLLGPLTYVVMQQIKMLSTHVDALPATAKRFAVAAIATVLTVFSSETGVVVTCDLAANASCLSTIPQDAIRAALAAGLAYVLHLSRKKPEA